MCIYKLITYITYVYIFFSKTRGIRFKIEIIAYKQNFIQFLACRYQRNLQRKLIEYDRALRVFGLRFKTKHHCLWTTL